MTMHRGAHGFLVRNQMTNTTRVAIIVLGMHRSGTSAVAGAAVRLGLAPPRTPLAPTLDNPTGFHESIPVVDLNHLILNAVGRDWYHCLSFEPDMLDDDAQATTFDRCTAILRQEFNHEPAFVMKDPLLCLTLPIWLPALRALNAAVSALLVLRHPEEVARSLFQRDMLPEANTAAVWLHYMLEAERMTRNVPRAVIFYHDFLRDWRRCMSRAGRDADIAWPHPPEQLPSDMGDVASPSLRHYDAAADSVAIGPPCIRDLVNEAWSAFRQLGDSSLAPFACNRLDFVRARFAAHRKVRQFA
jgi:hypothetical protein